MSLFPLRDHQAVALDLLRQSILAGKRRIILQLPTGAGKTVIAAHMIAGALAKGNRVAFSVPMIQLVKQTIDRFTENGIAPRDIGVMQANHAMRRHHAPVQVCSVQTVERRGFPDATFVIVDEAHVRFKTVDRWISENPRTLFVGLTATPWSAGMGEVWDDLIIPTTLSELIDLKMLSPFRVFAAGKPDLSGVKVVAGEYHEGQLSEVMSGRQIVADVVSNWLEKGEGRQTLMFAVDRAHAATLHDQFNEVGVTCAYIDGEMSLDERKPILERFDAGEIKIISSVATMTTGADVKCQCIIDAAPTKSEIQHVQKIGRGLRTEADTGKVDCIVFDHAGNCLRLGLPTEIGRNTLRTSAGDEKERSAAKEKVEPLPRECRQCGCLMPPRVKVCEACGYEFKRQSDVETVDGELVELGGKAKPKAAPAIERLRKMGKQAVYGQLWGAKGSKSSGWVAHKYRSIFGVWPRGLDPVSYEATPEMKSWLHSERIRFAAGQAKFRAAHEADARELANAP